MDFYEELLKEYILQEEIENNAKNLNEYLATLNKNYSILNRYLKTKKYEIDFEKCYDEFVEIKEKINNFNLESLNQKTIQTNKEKRAEAIKLITNFIEEVDFENLNIKLNKLVNKNKKILEVEENEEIKNTLKKMLKINSKYTKYIYNEINFIIEKYNKFFDFNIKKQEFKVLN